MHLDRNRRCLAAVVWLVLSWAETLPAREAPRHVVMVSVDGMMPASYMKADDLGLKVPNLRRLMRRGAFARGVVGVLPTVTYPSHATLITGVPPRVHGIASNTVFDPAGTSNEAWNWYASEVRVPTLVSAARARWLRTAAVSWPVSVGLDADFLLPEFWRSGSEHESDRLLLEQLSTPHLLEAVEHQRGRRIGYPLTDDDRTDVALFLLTTYRPDLMLLHVANVDHEEHVHGPMSPEAKEATEKADARIGRLLETLETAGLVDQTILAVVSDHGFLPISRELRPNAVLREAGLLKMDEKGHVTAWQAAFHADGGSAALHLKVPSDHAVLERVRALFEPKLGDGLREILDAKAIAELGGVAETPLVLNATEGASFSNAPTSIWSGPSKSKGTHGYAPNREELYASLIVTGPGIAPRDLGVVKMTSIAPTLAQYLGVTLAPEADTPLWRAE